MISTYAELKAAIQSWAKRSDILDQLDTFIDVAESTMYANPDASLRVRDMETRATWTLSTADRYEPLPARYLQVRQVKLNRDSGDRFLEYKSPEAIAISPDAGIPWEYTITSQIEFDRVPDDTYAIEFLYYASLAPLTSSATTNAILTRFPMVYLYGCLYAFYQWSMQEDRSTYYYNAFIKAIQGANSLDKRGRYHQPAGRIMGVTP